MYRKLISTNVIALSLLVFGCSSDDGGADMETTGMNTAPTVPLATPGIGNSAYDNIVNNAELSALLLAINTAGLANTLDNEATPFTIFAPDNAAFAALGNENAGVDFATLQLDPSTLTSILAYHVLDGTVDSTAASDIAPVDLATLNGATVRLEVSDTAGSGLSIGGADITDPDSNFDPENSAGVVHIINSVLVPPPAR